jgi:hypothetical protein
VAKKKKTDKTARKETGIRHAREASICSSQIIGFNELSLKSS